MKADMSTEQHEEKATRGDGSTADASLARSTASSASGPQHSPLPWVIEGPYDSSCDIESADGHYVAEVFAAPGELPEEQARYIVQACNAFPELVAALKVAFDLFNDSDPTERFERTAEEFYKATGFLRPGKSEPMAMCGGEEHERRREVAWARWSGEKRAAMLAQMSAAITKAEGRQ